MNNEQLEEVKKGIKSLRKYKINDVIKNYIGAKSPEYMIDVIRLQDIPNYFERMLYQFEQEIQDPDFVFYPESHIVDGEVSSLTYNMSRTYAKINLVCFNAIVIASSKIECLI